MTMRVLIVDDEPAARRGIRQRLATESDIEIVGECSGGGAAIEAIPELRPDLVFLDIQMPELGGFDVIEAVGLARMPRVIFVTAYDAHAVRAFDVQALDYVLKPIDGVRFRAALERARREIGRGDEALAGQIADALEALGRAGQRRWARRLAVRSPGRIVLIDVDDVDRIEAAGNYAEVHVGAKAHLLRETLTSLESRLDPEQFTRVSRSAIVNIGRVRELQAMFNGDFVVILRDGTQVGGSRRHRATLDALIR
ncbi:MAG: response regulator transcription factor [Rhodanobacteraceae bacterium]|nr:response regulator transcription factor [Rhodanobacteraceae bacterium]